MLIIKVWSVLDSIIVDVRSTRSVVDGSPLPEDSATLLHRSTRQMTSKHSADQIAQQVKDTLDHVNGYANTLIDHVLGQY